MDQDYIRPATLM